MSSITPSSSVSQVKSAGVDASVVIQPPVYPSFPDAKAQLIYYRLYEAYLRLASGMPLDESCFRPAAKSRYRRRPRAVPDTTSSASDSDQTFATSGVEVVKKSLVNEYPEGKCYLKAVQEGFRDEASSKLGVYPTFEQVLSLGSQLVPWESMKTLAVSRKAVGVFHLGSVGPSLYDTFLAMSIAYGKPIPYSGKVNSHLVSKAPKFQDVLGGSDFTFKFGKFEMENLRDYVVCLRGEEIDGGSGVERSFIPKAAGYSNLSEQVKLSGGVVMRLDPLQYAHVQGVKIGSSERSVVVFVLSTTTLRFEDILADVAVGKCKRFSTIKVVRPSFSVVEKRAELCAIRGLDVNRLTSHEVVEILRYKAAEGKARFADEVEVTDPLDSDNPIKVIRRQIVLKKTVTRFAYSADGKPSVIGAFRCDHFDAKFIVGGVVELVNPDGRVAVPGRVSPYVVVYSIVPKVRASYHVDTISCDYVYDCCFSDDGY